MHKGFWKVNQQKRYHVENLSANERIILNGSYRAEIGEGRLDLSRSGLGQVVVSFKQGDKFMDSTKFESFLTNFATSRFSGKILLH
jgi:hypothetical protein